MVRGPVGDAAAVVAQPAGEVRQRAFRRLRLASLANIIDAGRHHRDADDTIQAFIERRADDYVGVRVGLIANAGSSFVDLEQHQVPAAGDGDDEATGALDRGVLDQWIGNRGHSGFEHALLAGSLAPAHHGLALLAHDGENVGKIEIDQTFLDDKVADAGHTRIKHLVGQGEGIGECGLLVGHPEQVLVWDDQQGVHHLQQFRDAGFGKAAAALPTSGCEPAPRPLVTWVPIWMMRLAFDVVSACASVLATMKSTPCSPAVIMLLTALPPAPPTPNTIMRAFISLISVMSVIFASRLLRQAGE